MKHIIASPQGVVAELHGHDAAQRAQTAYNVISAQLRANRAVQVGDVLLIPGTPISIHEVLEVSADHAHLAVEDHAADAEKERVEALLAAQESAAEAEANDVKEPEPENEDEAEKATDASEGDA